MVMLDAANTALGISTVLKEKSLRTRMLESSAWCFVWTWWRLWNFYRWWGRFIDKRIFNYLAAWLAAFYIEISNIKNSMAPPPASGKPRPWNSHGPITDRLTTIINLQYCCIWTENVVCILQRIVIQYEKTYVQNTALKVLLWSMWIYVGGHLGADCFWHQSSWPVRSLWADYPERNYSYE